MIDKKPGPHVAGHMGLAVGPGRVMGWGWGYDRKTEDKALTELV